MIVLVGMLITITILVVTIYFELDELGASAFATSGVVTIILISGMCLTRFDTATYKIKRESLQTSYSTARNMSEFERVAITK